MIGVQVGNLNKSHNLSQSKRKTDQQPNFFQNKMWIIHGGLQTVFSV